MFFTAASRNAIDSPCTWVSMSATLVRSHGVGSAQLLVADVDHDGRHLVGGRSKVKLHEDQSGKALDPVGCAAVDTEAPIGIFDSGFGGLTVARAVIDQLPYEDVVYLGDTARAPYGEQPISQVREYALECLDHLLSQGVKALVIACNSASAAVLRDARERYPVPVVEVILPAARRAVAATRSGRVGVICTEATATSQAYDDAFAVAPQVELHTAPCPRFVSFVEAGITGGPELLSVRQGLPETASGRRHRHLDPGLHALPPAHRGDLLRAR